ncbi:MAG: response regulator [Candidatus Omnitrophota bacterium]
MEKIKIFILDDNENFLETVEDILVLSGYGVTTCSDASLAIAEILNAAPDVILLDLKMRVKNGFQIADELRKLEETACIPIIAMTGYYSEKEHLNLVKSCGIKDYLIKPFEPLDIIAKIELNFDECGEEDCLTNDDLSIFAEESQKVIL